MNFRKDENGQLTVFTALAMTVIFGCLALAIDVGLAFNTKRKLQNAVDAAATSGAIDYMFNYSHSSATTAATNALAANGFSVTPTVNFYPNITSTYHNNGDYYVQVIASVPDPTFFLGALNHRGQQTLNIQAGAIAGLPGQGNACVIVLDSNNDPKTMQLQGSFNVDAGGCGVVVDSPNADALDFTGGAGSLTAKYVAVVGGAGGQTGDSDPPPSTGATAVNNPFPSLAGQSASDCTTGASGNTLDFSGVKNGGTINASTTWPTPLNNVTCVNGNVSISGTVTLPPGVVVFENNVTIGGGSATTVYSGTGGTTIDVLAGQLSVGTNTNLALTAPPLGGSAPTSAVPAGFAIIQPLSNTNQLQLQTGSSCGYVDGMVYAPGAQLYLNDSGGDNCGGTGFGDITYQTDLIVYQLYDKTATLNISNYNNSLGALGPLTAVALVE